MQCKARQRNAKQCCIVQSRRTNAMMGGRSFSNNQSCFLEWSMKLSHCRLLLVSFSKMISILQGSYCLDLTDPWSRRARWWVSRRRWNVRFAVFTTIRRQPGRPIAHNLCSRITPGSYQYQLHKWQRDNHNNNNNNNSNNHHHFISTNSTLRICSVVQKVVATTAAKKANVMLGICSALCNSQSQQQQQDNDESPRSWSKSRTITTQHSAPHHPNNSILPYWITPFFPWKLPCWQHC